MVCFVYLVCLVSLVDPEEQNKPDKPNKPDEPDKRPMTVSPEEFDRWIQEALAELPPRFAALAEEVSIVVEEEPSSDVLQDLGLESEDDLLGLYQGVPIDQASFFQPAGELPARIAIYRGPILRLCRTKAEVIHEVRDTVVHELGHHVGLDDEEMPY
ncbi:MAG: metallopeptidase family protein [Nitrospirae bacterium]|nr:metallopeptidase family protein [Nitrospirota bacterium]